MKTLWALLAVVLLAMAGGLGYQFLYPPQVMKRATQAALDQVAQAVETQDKAQAAAALNALLTDDARIHLEVNFFMLMHAESSKLVTQDFDKPSFLAFIDNILYTVEDTHYIPKLTQLSLNEAGDAASVIILSRELARGPSYYAGTMVIMRFASDTTCSGEVVFIERAPRLREAKCVLQLRSTPTSEGNNTLQTTPMLREMLQKN